MVRLDGFIFSYFPKLFKAFDINFPCPWTPTEGLIQPRQGLAQSYAPDDMQIVMSGVHI